MYQVEIIITGIVQGVNYRYNTREVARKLGLTGWVKNMPDGSVKIIIQGKKKEIDKFIKWCQRGSELSKVENVDVSWIELEKEADLYKSFEIEY